MLVRADALATPVTQFESNKGAVAEAIRRSRPSTSALNLEQALGVCSTGSETAGAEGGRDCLWGRRGFPSRKTNAVPANLRVISIPSNGENCRAAEVRGAACGFRSRLVGSFCLSCVTTGRRLARSRCSCNSVGMAAGSKTMTLRGGFGETASDVYVSGEEGGAAGGAGFCRRTAAAMLFRRTDTAAIEVPIGKPLRVAVYSPEPDLLKPLLAGNPQVEAMFRLAGEVRSFRLRLTSLYSDRFVLA